MRKKYEAIVPIFWISLSIFVMVGSYKLGLGSFHNPGPGLMPFLLGIILLLVSIFIVWKSFSKIQISNDIPEERAPIKVNFWKIVLVSGSLIIYALLLDRLGFLVSTLLLLLFLFKAAGSQKWRFVMAASVLTVIIIYLFFTSLGIRFPKGVFKF
jgi:putative tricarboxylic transport membrane protein